MCSGPNDQTGTQTRNFFREPTNAGWEHFVERYGPLIYDWCRGRLRSAPGLVEDTAQLVLVGLWQTMRNGLRNWDPACGRLRAWLRTVVRNACHDALRSVRPAVPWKEGDHLDEDFVEQLARAEVVRLALDRTRAAVAARDWEVFRLHVLEQVGSAEAARQTGLAVGTVYNLASQVRRVVKNELARLEGPESGCQGDIP